MKEPVPRSYDCNTKIARPKAAASNSKAGRLDFDETLRTGAAGSKGESRRSAIHENNCRISS
jgi:hypothetical protein